MRLQLVDLLLRTGRALEAEQQIDVGWRALAGRGVDDGPLVEAKRWLLSTPRTAPRSARARELRQQIRFCRSFDGARIAYASVGEALLS